MKSKIIISALAFFAIVVSSGAANAGAASHGFVLFGNKQTYASHVMMFHAPHDWQMLIQLQLANLPSGPDTLTAYAANKAGGQLEFTMWSSPIDWQNLHNGSQFQAEIYKGNFEKDGVDLGPVRVTVWNILYSAKLNPAGTEQNQYLLFGDSGEFFAAHLVDGKPSFDMIMSIDEPHLLSFFPCRRECAPPYSPVQPKPTLPTTVTFHPIGEGIYKPIVGDELGTIDTTVTSVTQIIHFDDSDLQ